MREVVTHLTIYESTERIWNVLTDFEKYSSWSPLIESIEGKFLKNENIIVTMKNPQGILIKFKAIFTVIKDEREIRWRNKIIFRGLMDVEHFFILKKVDEKETRFIHGQRYRGLLSLLIKNSTYKFKPFLSEMNNSLKEKCELNKK